MRFLILLLPSLVLLGSIVFVLICSGLLVVSGIRGQRGRVRAIFRALMLYVLGYAVVLVVVGLIMPRRSLAAGERLCYDDWCVAALDAAPAEAERVAGCEGPNMCIVRLEVSSDAKRVRQRAADAAALLEDRAAHHYRPCGAPDPGGATLRDELGPAESFRVALAFMLPTGRSPVGVVIRHGYFPGCLVIGDDQSFAHRPTLYRVALPHGR